MCVNTLWLRATVNQLHVAGMNQQLQHIERHSALIGLEATHSSSKTTMPTAIRTKPGPYQTDHTASQEAAAASRTVLQGCAGESKPGHSIGVVVLPVVTQMWPTVLLAAGHAAVLACMVTCVHHDLCLAPLCIC